MTTFEFVDFLFLIILKRIVTNFLNGVSLYVYSVNKVSLQTIVLIS